MVTPASGQAFIKDGEIEARPKHTNPPITWIGARPRSCLSTSTTMLAPSFRQ